VSSGPGRVNWCKAQSKRIKVFASFFKKKRLFFFEKKNQKTF